MPKNLLPIRIYYEDTDAGGVVYYANYLKFAERGRTEFLRQLGFENSVLRATCGILIVVKKVEIDYKKPAVLDDSLVLETEMTAMGASSMSIRQTFRRGAEDVAVMDVILVCVSAEGGRPTRWPEDIRKALG